MKIELLVILVMAVQPNPIDTVRDYFGVGTDDVRIRGQFCCSFETNTWTRFYTPDALTYVFEDLRYIIRNIRNRTKLHRALQVICEECSTLPIPINHIPKYGQDLISCMTDQKVLGYELIIDEDGTEHPHSCINIVTGNIVPILPSHGILSDDRSIKTLDLRTDINIARNYLLDIFSEPVVEYFIHKIAMSIHPEDPTACRWGDPVGGSSGKSTLKRIITTSFRDRFSNCDTLINQYNSAHMYYVPSVYFFSFGNDLVYDNDNVRRLAWYQWNEKLRHRRDQYALDDSQHTNVRTRILGPRHVLDDDLENHVYNFNEFTTFFKPRIGEGRQPHDINIPNGAIRIVDANPNMDIYTIVDSFTVLILRVSIEIWTNIPQDNIKQYMLDLRP